MKRTQANGKHTDSATTAADLAAANAALAAVDPETGELNAPGPVDEGPEDVANSLATLCGKLVLFPIKQAERVPDGPVMRGFIEPKGEPQNKVNVAAWSKIGRESGTEYLSLKVGNNSAAQPRVYSVGPYFGSMFRQVEDEGRKIRYFGFIEDAERTGEDGGGRGIYSMRGRVRFTAKRAVSSDGQTHYLTGLIVAAETPQPDNGEGGVFPF
jgi:hypothetical protein